MQGVQAIAKAAPAIDRPAAAGALEQGVDVPLAVEPGDEERGDEEDAHGDDQRRRDLGQQLFVVAEGGAEGGRGQALGDEDRREAGDEEQAGAEDAPPPRRLQLRRGDAADSGEVARHQRQHAGREEGDDARGQGGEDAHSGGGIGAQGGDDHGPPGYPGSLSCRFGPPVGS